MIAICNLAILLSLNACELNEPLAFATVARLQVIKNFHSNVLNNKRDIRIYLPESYFNSNKYYPVMYMQDGQGVFSPGGWMAERTYDSLVSSGKIEEVILVGINNTVNRLSEYWPPYPYGAGTADQYLKFLTDELLPYIEENYRVKKGAKYCAILGSSAGGVFAFYAAWVRPDIFGMAACMSPSFWGCDESLLKYVHTYKGEKKSVKYWLDAGNAESEDPDRNGVDLFVEDAYDMTLRLIELGWKYGSDLLFDIDYTGIHNEISWKQRIYKPMIFFFGKGNRNIVKLTTQTSSPYMDSTGTVPNIMLFTKAYWDNGLSAEIPCKLLDVSSLYNDQWYIKENDRIYLNPTKIVFPDSIVFNISYADFETSTSLKTVTFLSKKVKLYVEIIAPVSSGDKIYMVGNNSALGDWDAAKGFQLRLSAVYDNYKIYNGTLQLSRNTAICFKFCSGPDWKYAECDSLGEVIPEHSIKVKDDCEYKGEIMQWKSR